MTEFEKIVKRTEVVPNERYASFDYCYNYFKTTHNLTQDIEKSCLVLGFYLASWGMYRGSTLLFGKSLKFLQTTVEYIASLDKSVWDIDVDTYNEENIKEIIKINNKLIELLSDEDGRRTTVTLTTKVMLGVFGFIPAFDSYFRETFKEICCYGFDNVNKKSLTFIKDFYDKYKVDIDRLSKEMKTFDFDTDKKTDINYTKAKIVDMYGWNYFADKLEKQNK